MRQCGRIDGTRVSPRFRRHESLTGWQVVAHVPYLAAHIASIFRPFPFVALATLGPFLIASVAGGRTVAARFAGTVGWSTGLFLYALFCVVAFRLGCALSLKPHPVESEVAVRNRQRTWPVFLTCLALSLAGLLVVKLSVSGNYTSIVVDSVAGSGFGRTLSDLRVSPEGFLRSVRQPGYIRMFASLTGGAIVLWVGFLASHPEEGNKARFLLGLLALVSLLTFKNLLVMDRVHLLGVTVLYAHVVERIVASRRASKRAYLKFGGALVLCLSLVVVCLAVGSMVSTMRGLNWAKSVLEYVDLGTANAELSLRTTRKFTYGFSTFFHPVLFAVRGLGLDVSIIPEADSRWIANPAANLLAYSLQDFHMYGVIVYVVLGFVVGSAAALCKARPRSLFAQCLYLYVMYGLYSVWAVPVFRSADYWAGFLVIMIATLFVGGPQGTTVRRMLAGHRASLWASTPLGMRRGRASL